MTSNATETTFTTHELAPLPVVVIGAGPIGLAAAANAAERGIPFVVLEAGPDAGAAVGDWAHVRLFSAWRELIDPAARRLLESAGRWTAPDEDSYPTGGEWRETISSRSPTCSTTPPRSRSATAPALSASAAPGRDLMVDSGRDERPVRRPRPDRDRARAAAGQRGGRRLGHVGAPEPVGRRRLPGAR